MNATNPRRVATFLRARPWFPRQMHRIGKAVPSRPIAILQLSRTKGNSRRSSWHGVEQRLPGSFWFRCKVRTGLSGRRGMVRAGIHLHVFIRLLVLRRFLWRFRGRCRRVVFLLDFGL